MVFSKEFDSLHLLHAAQKLPMLPVGHGELHIEFDHKLKMIDCASRHFCFDGQHIIGLILQVLSYFDSFFGLPYEGYWSFLEKYQSKTLNLKQRHYNFFLHAVCEILYINA